MKSNQSNWLFISAFILSFSMTGESQVSGFIKPGINFGFINKETWDPVYPEAFKYGKPLVRPTLACGLELPIKRLNISFSLMYQTKGQGAKVPKVRNLFKSVGPDAIHFMSFPVGLKYSIWPKLSIGVAIQPSLYLGGTDNYWASEYWKGWIWSSVFSISYYLQKEMEIGIEYDFDFTDYYCPGCDEKFYTYRLFVAYHFLPLKD